MEPSWKIPSRPCPFFAQGNCIFSKNCNFLHEISRTPSTVRSSSLDDSYGERQLRKGPVLQSRFSVDFDSSSEDEDSGSDDSNPDNHKDYVYIMSQKSFSRNPSGTNNPSTSSSRYHTRKNSVRDSHIRDSIMTVKESLNSSRASEPDPGHGVHSPPRTEQTNESRKHSRVPPLTLSIPHQFGSIHASHSLVLQDLKETLRREYGSQISPSNNNDYAVTAKPVQPINRSRSSTIRPHHHRYSQEDDKVPIREKLSMPATMPPTGLGSSADSTPFKSPVDEQGNTEEFSKHKDVASVNLSEMKPKTPQTPSWLKPLKLPTILSPKQNITYFQELGQQESPVSQSLSPTSLLAQYSLDVANDIAIENSAHQDIVIPTDSPRTIVLSDTEDNSIFVPPSRASTSDIDMTSFPPARSEYDDDSLSSVGSVTLSVLMGGSPGLSDGHALSPAISSFERATDSHKERPTSPKAEEFHSKLERRAQRIKESVSILSLKGNGLNFVMQEAGFSSPTEESDEPVGGMKDVPFVNNSLQVEENVVQSLHPSKLLDQSPKELPQRNSATSRPPHSASSTRSPDPSYRPQLLFAIASDKPETVEDLLATGKSTVNEMADSGTDLLEFTVSNNNLKHKTQIVKTLLKYGADPAILTRHEKRRCSVDQELKQGKSSPEVLVNKHMNAAMEYFLTRQSLDSDSKPTLQVLEQSSFAPLAKARFDIIGQDRVLDEFYRVIGLHSQRKTRNALVILLCGASGHGKSFLAQKVGSLLNVPIHTINMTALRSQHDLWQCLSTGAEDASPNIDLGEFLVENQGRRCVVVLDEIEKVDDPKALNPLLLPWDIGRCSLEQKKHTDTSQVIWIATSNLGQKIITEHVQQWNHQDIPPTRNEYIQLATAIRRSTSEVLGAPILSRITAILPFLPFTLKEKRAIGTEAALSYQDLLNQTLSPEDIDALVARSVHDSNLVEEEGARSLYRVVEAHMINFNESNNRI